MDHIFHFFGRSYFDDIFGRFWFIGNSFSVEGGSGTFGSGRVISFEDTDNSGKINFANILAKFVSDDGDDGIENHFNLGKRQSGLFRNFFDEIDSSDFVFHYSTTPFGFCKAK